MKKFISLSVALISFLLFEMFVPANSLRADAAGNLLPTGNDNLQTARLISTSELVATKTGFMRVFYDGSKIRIENYDNSFQIQSKKSLDMELSLWGGFYAGSDSYYIVEGQNNTAEDDDAEVIRVIRYDTSWNRKGAAKITGNTLLFGGEVCYPFDYGCVEMTEYNGKLYVVTGHEGYADSIYGGHQGFLMLEVDEATMTGQIVDCDLWHSFAQYITNKGSDLYVLEQSEGSRYTKLSRYSAGDWYFPDSIPVLNYGGSHDSDWAIPCYASVNGMALSDKNVLCLGTSIDQDNYDNVTYYMPHNIYLTITPMADFTEEATKVKWLTDYTGNTDEGKSFLGTKITKINDDRFMISWEEYNESKTASTDDSLSGSVLHYLFVNGSGEKLTKEFTAAAPISDCQPIVKDSKVFYYASNSNMVNFYTIDANTGAFSKKSYRVAGENATWSYKNGTLTVSGTGAISVPKSEYRRPVSFTSGGYSYSDLDLSPWKGLSDRITKLVINSGITSISDEAFASLKKLTEVDIASGVKSIGNMAFAYNGEWKKITIPASVTQIGEDILWSGSYWVGDGSHVVYATIYGKAGSYAQTYAKNNDIGFVAILDTPKLNKVENTATGVKISWGKVTGAEKYRVFYNTGSGWKKIADTTDTSYTWKGAKSGTKYSFTVRCVSSDGTEFTSSYDKTGKSITYIAAPGKLAAENVNGGIKVSWNKVNGAAKYRVYYKTGNGSWTKIADTTSTSYTWKGAKSGTTYKFTVRCLSSDSKSFTSSYNSTGVSAKYIATPKLTSVANTSSGVKLSWNASKGAAKYRVFYKTASGWKKIADTASTSYTWTGAKSGTTYTFTVRCVSSDSKSFTSGYDSTGKTLKRLAQPNISNLEVNNSGVKITWNKVAGASTYKVYYKTASGWKQLRNTASTSCTINATMNKSYTYTVKAVSGSYNSSYNSSGSTIKRINTPAKPAAVKTSTGYKLSWNKITGAGKYRIYYKTANGSWKKLADTTSTSYTWNNMPKGTTYYVTVRCLSADGKQFTSGYNTTGTSIKR